MNTQSGLVGFFDILGYQNLLEKNEPEDMAQSVLPILTHIDTTVKKGLPKIFHTEKEAEQELSLIKIIDSIKWLVFSDSILITMPLEDTIDRESSRRWTAFMSLCISLQGSMFKAGLPLRGAITHGKFVIQDTFFAGRAIVEAYKFCNKLDLAACVFTNNARNALLDQDKYIQADIGSTFFKTGSSPA